MNEKLKITILFNEEKKNHETIHDEVVDQVANALTEGGHIVSLLGINNNLLHMINGLEKQQPELVFNLCETFADNYYGEMYVAAVLSMLNLRFTGTGAAGMALRQDKAVTKKLLAFYDIPCPQYATFAKDKLEFAGKMKFPLFVKPLKKDSSAGIDEHSLVNDYNSLMKKIDYIHKELKDTALVEEYIEGREFYVSVLGNDPQEALPLIELDYSKLPEGVKHIYSEKAKFDENSKVYELINFGIATDINPEIRNKITMIGVKAAAALQVYDYARVDIRLAQDGTPYVVEVNANPYLENTAEFAVAALQAGMAYSTLINKIVEIAWNRFKNEESRSKLAHIKKELIKKETEKTNS
jgi:D-alanine-D-alanine ligase